MCGRYAIDDTHYVAGDLCRPPGHYHRLHVALSF